MTEPGKCARVVVKMMPGSFRAWQPDLHGYWRYRCTACGDVGHWTTADYAHDDGREHARGCAALKYARLVELIKEIAATPFRRDLAAALFGLARAL